MSNAADGDGECDITSLLEVLGKVTDRRGARGKIYDLVFILAVSLVAVLAGASHFRQIGTWLRERARRTTEAVMVLAIDGKV